MSKSAPRINFNYYSLFYFLALQNSVLVMNLYFKKITKLDIFPNFETQK